jgi:hypothetical protein
MNDHIAILAEHVAGTLPDSITRRIRVLQALLAVTTVKHPARPQIQEQLFNLQTIIRQQEELPLMFTNQEIKP